MDGWTSTAIKYPRSHRAGIVWGDWLRQGKPRMTTCFRCTLANPEHIGEPDSSHVPFMAYGTDADNYVATLFDAVYEDQPPGIQVQLIWFYARYQSPGGRNPLMIWPVAEENAEGQPIYWPWHPRAGQVMDGPDRKLPGSPIDRVTDYCFRWKMTRPRFFARLNKALHDVELEMIERDREDSFATPTAALRLSRQSA